jgi:hypothetical protein
MYRPRVERTPEEHVRTQRAAEHRLTPEWDEGTRNMIRFALRDFDFGTTLNDGDIGMLRDEVFKIGRVDHAPLVVSTAQNMLLCGRFSSVMAALESAQQIVPEYDARGQAGASMVLKAAYEGSLDCADDNALASIINHLGEKGRLILSDVGRAKKNQIQTTANELAERNRLYAEITRGKDAFPLFDPRYGKARQIPAATLETETTESLRTIAASVAAYRAARDGKASTINPSQVDSTEGVASNYTPTRQQADLTQQAQPEAANDLIDPHTNARYTRSALLQLIKTDLNTFRALKAKNVRLLDQILATRS